MIRITADIDSKNQIKVLYYFLKGIFKIKELYSAEIKKSNSKGFHFVYFTNKKYSQKQILELRAIIGDDKRRIIKDKIRKQPKQYLFFKKIKIDSELFKKITKQGKKKNL